MHVDAGTTTAFRVATVCASRGVLDGNRVCIVATVTFVGAAVAYVSRRGVWGGGCVCVATCARLATFGAVAAFVLRAGRPCARMLHLGRWSRRLGWWPRARGWGDIQVLASALLLPTEDEFSPAHHHPPALSPAPPPPRPRLTGDDVSSIRLFSFDLLHPSWCAAAPLEALMLACGLSRRGGHS